MTEKLDITMRETVNNMVTTLLAHAEANQVDISEVTVDNFNGYLDDQFHDGGEARCEYFADLAWEYADQFGELESDEFMNAQWKCIEAALKRIETLPIKAKKFD